MIVDEKAHIVKFLTMLQRAIRLNLKEVYESRKDGTGWSHLYGRVAHLVKWNESMLGFVTKSGGYNTATVVESKRWKHSASRRYIVNVIEAGGHLARCCW